MPTYYLIKESFLNTQIVSLLKYIECMYTVIYIYIRYNL